MVLAFLLLPLALWAATPPVAGEKSLADLPENVGPVVLIRQSGSRLKLKISFVDDLVPVPPDPPEWVKDCGHEASASHPVPSKCNGRPPPKPRFRLAGKIDLYDDHGRLATLSGPFEFTHAQWCENDGGIHYRPETEVEIDRDALKRALQPRKAADGIVAFAVTGSIPPSLPKLLQAAPNPKKVIMRARLPVLSGPSEILLAAQASDAGCGINDAQDDLFLFWNGFHHELRCCGP